MNGSVLNRNTAEDRAAGDDENDRLDPGLRPRGQRLVLASTEYRGGFHQNLPRCGYHDLDPGEHRVRVNPDATFGRGYGGGPKVDLDGSENDIQRPALELLGVDPAIHGAEDDRLLDPVSGKGIDRGRCRPV